MPTPASEYNSKGAGLVSALSPVWCEMRFRTPQKYKLSKLRLPRPSTRSDYPSPAFPLYLADQGLVRLAAAAGIQNTHANGGVMFTVEPDFDNLNPSLRNRFALNHFSDDEVTNGILI